MTDTICSPEVYRQNLEFWDRAWNGVKVPYTQLPDLDYVPRIPSAIETKKSQKVLDLGCGSGWLSIFLARNGFDVIGVDVAKHAVELGQMWAKDENLNIDFQVQDISDLHFPSCYFGSVVANSIFEHLTYDLAKRTLELLSKMLLPGGIFVGCFDKVGTGPGEFYKLDDGSQIYTDKGRKGMLLRCFSDDELKSFFSSWKLEEFCEVAGSSRFIIATRP